MNPLPELLARRLARPAAILGDGVSGRAMAAALAAAGRSFVVYDVRGDNPVLGAEQAARHDLALLSPGFAQSHPWVLAARRAGCLCLGELDLAALLWDGPAVAVTGTNGKTTLTEFLAFAHKRAGRNAVACGNIGLPFTTVACDAAVAAGGLLPVVEVSSFQAEDLRHFAPEAVLWTNLDEDHLDRHGDMESYFRAKHKLVERLLPAGILVVGESVVDHARNLGLALPPETRVARRADVAGKAPAGSPFDTWPQLENWALALAYWEARGLPVEALEEAARLFRAAPHRLRKVAEAGLLEFWNDSKGTNFHATLAALESFDCPVRWIGGGKWKGGDLRRFAERVAPRIERAHLLGETGPELLGFLRELGKPCELHATLEEATLAAGREPSPVRAAVLLSPGFASLDMFRGYAERGHVFERAAQGLALRPA
jgi:UDP-N-acetylmuramoylalanine--D-glutamate ligase